MPPFRDFTPNLAKEPDLIAAISRDIALRGLVGEEDAGLLVYLAYSSRKLNNPLSVIIRGPSGSGKDCIQRVPSYLMPPKSIVDAMSLTPEALFYVGNGKNGSLRHKILLGGERRHGDDPDQRDRTTAIRQLLSQKYITKQSVSKGDSKAFRQDGPVSYSETTTQEIVFQEDLSRCLLLRTNSSGGQNARVVDAVLSEYEPGEREADRWFWLEKAHHDFQNWLKPVDVRIPYARRLGSLMPSDRVEIRRIARQVAGLIEVIAYINQYQRKPDKDGKVLATIDDYRIARRLLVRSMQEVAGAKPDERDADLEKLPEEFTTTEAGFALGVSEGNRTTPKRWAERLVKVGVLTFVGASPNGGHVWRKTGTHLSDLILPTVEAL